MIRPQSCAETDQQQQKACPFGQAFRAYSTCVEIVFVIRLQNQQMSQQEHVQAK